MATRVTIYGDPQNSDTKRLEREMNVAYVEFETIDPRNNAQAIRHLADWGEDGATLPMVEVMSQDDSARVFLRNPTEPALRQCLYSEGIVSVTSYWL